MTATDQQNPASLRGLGWGTFLAGFVPGLLQFQLGQKGRAILAFLSCTALFFIGWVLVRDRLFYFALFAPETDPVHLSTVGILARCGITVTLPEILNFPANAIGSILAFDPSYEAQRLWRLPRALEDLGGFLTAASGYLAAFWSADGHWGMRLQRDGGVNPLRPICNPAFAAGISWLLPGAGHALAGQRSKGILMGASTVLVFALGLLLSQGHAVDRAIASVWWIGQSMCGGGVLFASLVTAPQEITGSFPENLDLGTVLCTVGGLMNLVVMVDAFSVAERSVFPVLQLHEGDA
ncbi:MAG: DUF6677 family protein [Planctomycetota bacterium]